MSVPKGGTRAVLMAVVVGAVAWGWKRSHPPPAGVGGGQWPNEPQGFVPISGYGFDDTIPATDKALAFGTSRGHGQWNPGGDGVRNACRGGPPPPPAPCQVEY